VTAVPVRFNRLFLYTYTRRENIYIAAEHQTFGAPGGDKPKMMMLSAGDLIVIKGPQPAPNVVRILGCCLVTGRPYESEERLWPDDEYPIRVPVNFWVSQPKEKWHIWDDFAKLDIPKSGQLRRFLKTGQEWGAIFGGNFIDRPMEVDAMCQLLKIERAG
jgi:hypothetical protein